MGDGDVTGTGFGGTGQPVQAGVGSGVIKVGDDGTGLGDGVGLSLFDSTHTSS